MNLFAAKNMAVLYMAEHGLFEKGWNFKFDTAKRRFGCCFQHKKIITLSAPITKLNDVDEVKDVILHEIAHAIAGPKADHGPIWKAVCIKIGARPERCYNENAVNTPPAKYTATCICGKVYKKHKRPGRDRVYWCKCQDNKRIKIHLQFKRGG